METQNIINLLNSFENAKFATKKWYIIDSESKGNYSHEPSNPLNNSSESFKYKTSIIGKTPQNNDSLTDAEVVTPLKYLSKICNKKMVHYRQ